MAKKSGNIFTNTCVYIIGVKPPKTSKIQGCTLWTVECDWHTQPEAYSLKLTNYPYEARTYKKRKDAVTARKAIEKAFPKMRLVVQCLELNWRVTNSTPTKFLRGEV